MSTGDISGLTSEILSVKTTRDKEKLARSATYTRHLARIYVWPHIVANAVTYVAASPGHEVANFLPVAASEYGKVTV